MKKELFKLCGDFECVSQPNYKIKVELILTKEQIEKINQEMVFCNFAEYRAQLHEFRSNKWQSIDSAPKDDSVILVETEDEICQASYEKGLNGWFTRYPEGGNKRIKPIRWKYQINYKRG